MKNVFVSYNFKDQEVVHTVQNMAGQFSGGNFAKFELTKNVALQGDAAIDQEIRRVMNSCDSVLFVIGNNNHNSPWINREVELAISADKRLVLTRLPGTTGGPPARLAGHPIAEWKPNKLADALR